VLKNGRRQFSFNCSAKLFQKLEKLSKLSGFVSKAQTVRESILDQLELLIKVSRGARVILEMPDGKREEFITRSISHARLRLERDRRGKVQKTTG